MLKQQILTTLMAAGLVSANYLRAEEGGSGHYLPGAMASFIDAFPGQPGALATMGYFTYYGGGASGDRTLPWNGLLTAGIDATVFSGTIAAIYQVPGEVLGGGFAFGGTLPYVWMEVEGSAQAILPGGGLGPPISSRDYANGVGDIALIPFMLGWTNLVKDLKLDTRLTIYTPTGEYQQGELANVGKNYWTFEPGIMANWVSSKIGTEITLYTGVDFNTENPATDYTSGTSLHFDLTVAQHLPAFGGMIGVGANGFYYQQITGDSGSGAVLGDFEGYTMGVGPVISYIRQVGETELLAELKWLPELNVDNRMQGDIVWFKVGFVF